MDYANISKETFDLLYKARESLSLSSLDSCIRILVELRISQINRCNYCCQFHTKEAKKAGIEEKKYAELSHWETSSSFSEKEKIAFKWAESVTSLNQVNEIKSLLSSFFSEKEIVDLTATIAIMNALNRVAITLRDED